MADWASGLYIATGLRAASASGLLIGIILIIISMFGAMGLLIDCMHRSYACYDYRLYAYAAGILCMCLKRVLFATEVARPRSGSYHSFLEGHVGVSNMKTYGADVASACV